jgi:hypothetical protein
MRTTLGTKNARNKRYSSILFARGHGDVTIFYEISMSSTALVLIYIIDGGSAISFRTSHRSACHIKTLVVGSNGILKKGYTMLMVM